MDRGTDFARLDQVRGEILQPARRVASVSVHSLRRRRVPWSRVAVPWSSRWLPNHESTPCRSRPCQSHARHAIVPRGTGG